MIPGEYKNVRATLTDKNNISIHALGIMATWENRKSSRAENPLFSILFLQDPWQSLKCTCRLIGSSNQVKYLPGS